MKKSIITLCMFAVFEFACAVSVSTLYASFIFFPRSPAPGQIVQFTDTSVGTPTSWQWNFGDGVTNTTQNPRYSYAAAGAYTVTLTVGAGSSSNSTSKIIAIGYADVITAASASFADVSAAVSRAKAGDTVVVPAGTATWSSRLVITKGINLIGAGVGSTVITSAYNDYIAGGANTDPENYLITYQPSSPSSNDAFRFSGFTVNGNNKSHVFCLYNTSVDYPITKIRVDHNYFYNATYSVCAVLGPCYGVIDNNTIQPRASSGTMIFQFWGPDDSWSHYGYDFGTSQTLYIEDNILYFGDAGNSSGSGSRWCYRHNSFTAQQDTWPGHDAHGNNTSGGNTSTMGIEIYNNAYNYAGYGGWWVDQRGGKALVFNNTITNASSIGVQIREEYLDTLGPLPANNSISGQPQHVSDSYYWNNTVNGNLDNQVSIGNTIDYGGNEGLVPRENAHFWSHELSFNGTVGVGVGPISARPVTCTKGVGYWATDENKFYGATATNTWTLFYTPYSYPHPLRSIL